jgi:hypothetical protein
MQKASAGCRGFGKLDEWLIPTDSADSASITTILPPVASVKTLNYSAFESNALTIASQITISRTTPL